MSRHVDPRITEIVQLTSEEINKLRSDKALMDLKAQQAELRQQIIQELFYVLRSARVQIGLGANLPLFNVFSFLTCRLPDSSMPAAPTTEAFMRIVTLKLVFISAQDSLYGLETRR
jgi:hypothetical protein